MSIKGNDKSDKKVEKVEKARFQEGNFEIFFLMST